MEAVRIFGSKLVHEIVTHALLLAFLAMFGGFAIRSALDRLEKKVADSIRKQRGREKPAEYEQVIKS